MSLLGSYRKKTSSDGYESLQLVDSNGDLSAGSGGGGGKPRGPGGAAARSPARQPPDRASTMDSSGSAALCARRVRQPGPRPGRGGPGVEGISGHPGVASLKRLQVQVVVGGG